MDSNVVVVNLEKRPDRFLKFEKAAKKTGITNYARFNAVDGTQISKGLPILKIFKENDHNYRQGIIGCALSHLKIWENLIESEKEYQIVFEDDAEFVSDFMNLYNEYFNKIKEMDPEWDLIYIAGPCSYSERNTISGNLISKTESIVIPTEEAVHNTKTSMTTLGYVISRKGAQLLINKSFSSGVKQSIDWFMIKSFPELKVYARCPYLAYSRDVNDTDIQHNYLSIN